MTTTVVNRPLARASYAALALYAPDRAPCAVDLSDNTNLWGMPPGAARVLRELAPDTITRYPAVYADRLKEALARYIGVSSRAVVTGCGSDDVLDSAFRAFGEPGERVAYPDPSFAMIPHFARMNGLEPVPVPLTPSLDADADALLATDARIIYLCSPNNPTGTGLSRAVLERIVTNAPGVVILDEAYAEFAGDDARDLAACSDRVLITRTLSKAFGLAGLRIGYAVGAPELIAEVEKSRGPYKVSVAAERAALAALTEDLAWVRARIVETCEMREWLAGELRSLGLAPLPSRANFVLAPVAGATALARVLRERGVAVRPFGDLPTSLEVFRYSRGEALRITAGPRRAMDALLHALRASLPAASRGGQAARE